MIRTYEVFFIVYGVKEMKTKTKYRNMDKRLPYYYMVIDKTRLEFVPSEVNMY